MKNQRSQEERSRSEQEPNAIHAHRDRANGDLNSSPG
jgi:hypothetical protein